MRNGILIISHKRPECPTLKTLKKVGYTGEVRIVADDLDETPYEELYPGIVVRFCKKDYMQTTDTVDNFNLETTPVYARNACFDIARSLKWECFGLFDDDLTDFKYRYISGARALSKTIKRFSLIFDAYCRYLIAANFASLCFVSCGWLVGGAKNKMFQEMFHRRPANAFIINIDLPQTMFVGTLWEDMLYSYINNIQGRLVFACMPIVMSMPSPGSLNAGGNFELYVDKEKYIAHSYANIAIPSFTHIRGAQKCLISQDLPRIISDKWKKGSPLDAK